MPGNYKHYKNLNYNYYFTHLLVQVLLSSPTYLEFLSICDKSSQISCLNSHPR